MAKEFRNLAKIPDKLAMALAADADLNKTWINAGTEHRTPAELITVAQALIVQSQLIELEDVKLPSPN
jgi:hypothetical protein